MNGRIEILAPAGSMESLTAAVRCGANAVYLGGREFNARRSAQNFGDEELGKAVEYCHVRDVRVLLTLNTVMTDDELPRLLDQAQSAAAAGVDGMIIQDLGIAALLQRVCPDMPLSASTQMAIHNLDGALEAKSLGFSRVVLAREMSGAEIARVAGECDIETEVFVHGALCMCVSGQCYLSSMLGGRSGNRGMCAQPCRLPFASDQREYGLSLKDLSLVDRIGELEAMGVRSLKIEGRMKRPEYVAAAVSACVAARDGRPVDSEGLRSVFSRGGFTSGYFDGKIGPDMFGIRQKEDVTVAAPVLDGYARLYHAETPLVPVDMVLTLEAGLPVCLTVKDSDGHEAAVRGPAPQAALNRPTDEALVRRGLAKTGGTPYGLRELRCTLGDGLMMPVSAINALRKEALDELTCQRAAETPYYAFDPLRARTPVPSPVSGKAPPLRMRLQMLEQLTAPVIGQAEAVILPLAQLTRGTVWRNCGVPVWGELPQAMFTQGERRARERLEALAGQGVTDVTAGNLGAARMAREAGFAVHGDFSLNLLNSFALESVKDLGLRDVTLSFELDLQKAKRVERSLPVGILAYGHLPLMLVRSCPLRGAEGCGGCHGRGVLTDRLGNKSPVDCLERECARVLNDRPLYLGDRADAMAGFDFATLYFTHEHPARCAEVVRLYRKGGELSGRRTGGLYFRDLL